MISSIISWARLVRKAYRFRRLPTSGAASISLIPNPSLIKRRTASGGIDSCSPSARASKAVAIDDNLSSRACRGEAVRLDLEKSLEFLI